MKVSRLSAAKSRFIEDPRLLEIGTISQRRETLNRYGTMY